MSAAYEKAAALLEKLGETGLKIKAQRDLLIDAAEQAIELMDNYVDVVDGDYGQPAPNKAMRAVQTLKDAIEEASR